MDIPQGYSLDQYKRSIAKHRITESKKRMLEVLFNMSSLDEYNLAFFNFSELAGLVGLSCLQTSRNFHSLREAGFVSFFYDASIRKNVCTMRLPEGSKLFEVKEEERSKPAKPSKPKTQDFKSLLDSNIEESLRRIKKAYHPKRAFLQPATARSSFFKICREEAKKVTYRGQKLEAVEVITRKIISYIDELKKDPSWEREGGKYIQGLGNFLQGGAWKLGSNCNVKKPRDSEIERLENFFKDGGML